MFRIKVSSVDPVVGGSSLVVRADESRSELRTTNDERPTTRFTGDPNHLKL